MKRLVWLYDEFVMDGDRYEVCDEYLMMVIDIRVVMDLAMMIYVYVTL